MDEKRSAGHTAKWCFPRDWEKFVEQVGRSIWPNDYGWKHNSTQTEEHRSHSIELSPIEHIHDSQSLLIEPIIGDTYFDESGHESAAYDSRYNDIDSILNWRLDITEEDVDYSDDSDYESSIRNIFGETKNITDRLLPNDYFRTPVHLIYYVSDWISEPIGVFQGSMDNTELNYRSNTGCIRSNLVANQSHVDVMHCIKRASNVITITTTDNGIACIQGETGGGFTFGGGSVLKLEGQLIIRSISGDEKAMNILSSCCNVQINKHIVFVIICYDRIILLDSGQKQYKIII